MRIADRNWIQVKAQEPKMIEWYCPLGTPNSTAISHGAKVQRIDPAALHGLWIEDLAWTRRRGVELPVEQKPMEDLALALARPIQPPRLLGRREPQTWHDDKTQEIWDVAVQETRAFVVGDW